jgi:hypothetical protein
VRGGLSTTQLIKAWMHTAGKIAHTCVNLDYEDNTKRKDSSTLKSEKCTRNNNAHCTMHNNAPFELLRFLNLNSKFWYHLSSR